MKFLSQINVNTEYTLPMVDGTDGQVLSTDGQGVAYWGTISAGSLTLGGLSDVVITSPASGQILRYGIPVGSSDTTPVWHNFTPNFVTAGSAVTITGAQTITGSKTFTAATSMSIASGSSTALTITKAGNGEALYVNKTSGSGNAVTIIGTLNATNLVRNGGTSSQFLKADGSVDTNTYLTSLPAHNHTNATTSVAGFMSTTDKSKLDGIASSANNYSLPTATASVLGGVKVGGTLTISSGILNARIYVGASSGEFLEIAEGEAAGDGVAGYVPAASSAQYLSFLRGDGTWQTITDTNTTYTAGTGLTLTGTTFSVTANTFAAASHTHAIADVTGLQTALNEKQASLGFTPYNATNPSGYISSYVDTVTSVGIVDDLSTGDIVLKGSGATTITKVGGTITITSTDTDTNTTYSAGTGLTLSGTTFSVTANTFAAASHVHTIANVTGLQTALNGKLSSDSDSEQDVGGRYFRFNNGINRINIDPRWNESGYDANLGVFHMYSTTAGGVQWGRTGIALYSGSAYQYLTTKAGTTGIFLNNQEIIYAGNIGSQSVNFATSAGTSTNLIGLGSIQSTSTGTSYQNNYQVRENSGGGSNTNEIYAPQLGFHWSGVVASSIMMEASGRIAIRNNPGDSYENFAAAVITATGGNSTQWNTAYGWGDHAAANYASEDFVTSQGYITEYTEADTLASVTGRGASTTTNLTFNGTLTMGTGGTQYIRMGRFPASTVNTGEAWIGRASDRNTGTMTVQLGGNSASSRSFEVVDYAWSVVLFSVSSSGNLTTSGTITENSSIRYKKDVVDIESTSSKVQLLRPVKYKKIRDESEEIGLIAEDVAELFPEVVRYDDEGRPDGVNYSRLSVILLKAVQELTERVNKLENK